METIHRTISAAETATATEMQHSVGDGSDQKASQSVCVTICVGFTRSTVADHSVRPTN
jgi:hypothetical protein